jgi:hypothetical protein
MPDHVAGHHPDLLTISEAAELLRAPVATLRYWRHPGHRPTQLPPRPPRAIPPRRPPGVGRGAIGSKRHRIATPRRGRNSVGCRLRLVGSLGHAACPSVPSLKSEDADRELGRVRSVEE